MITPRYEYAALKIRIKEKYGKYSHFANVVGMEESLLSLKLAGKVGFKQKDIILFAEKLDIPVEEYHKYFFE